MKLQAVVLPSLFLIQVIVVPVLGAGVAVDHGVFSQTEKSSMLLAASRTGMADQGRAGDARTDNRPANGNAAARSEADYSGNRPDQDAPDSVTGSRNGADQSGASDTRGAPESGRDSGAHSRTDTTPAPDYVEEQRSGADTTPAADFVEEQRDSADTTPAADFVEEQRDGADTTSAADFVEEQRSGADTTPAPDFVEEQRSGADTTPAADFVEEQRSGADTTSASDGTEEAENRNTGFSESDSSYSINLSSAAEFTYEAVTDGLFGQLHSYWLLEVITEDIPAVYNAMVQQEILPGQQQTILPERKRQPTRGNTRRNTRRSPGLNNRQQSMLWTLAGVAVMVNTIRNMGNHRPIRRQSYSSGGSRTPTRSRSNPVDVVRPQQPIP